MAHKSKNRAPYDPLNDQALLIDVRFRVPPFSEVDQIIATCGEGAIEHMLLTADYLDDEIKRDFLAALAQIDELRAVGRYEDEVERLLKLWMAAPLKPREDDEERRLRLRTRAAFGKFFRFPESPDAAQRQRFEQILPALGKLDFDEFLNVVAALEEPVPTVKKGRKKKVYRWTGDEAALAKMKDLVRERMKVRAAARQVSNVADPGNSEDSVIDRLRSAYAERMNLRKMGE